MELVYFIIASFLVVIVPGPTVSLIIANSLTAGASLWYGGSKTRKQGAQYKPSNFYAIYVGFRCAFENN